MVIRKIRKYLEVNNIPGHIKTLLNKNINFQCVKKLQLVTPEKYIFLMANVVTSYIPDTLFV